MRSRRDCDDLVVPDTLRARLQADLTDAMKARDKPRTAVLRSTLAALANAEAVDPGQQSSLPRAFGTTEVARRELTPEDERAIVERERAELTSAAAELRQHGRPAAAAELDAQAAVLAAHLT